MEKQRERKESALHELPPEEVQILEKHLPQDVQTLLVHPWSTLRLEVRGQKAVQCLEEAQEEWIKCMKVFLKLVYGRPDLKVGF